MGSNRERDANRAQTAGAVSRQRGTPDQKLPDGFTIASNRVNGMSIEHITRYFAQEDIRSGEKPASMNARPVSLHRGRATFGFREFLEPEVGDGYWDWLQPNKNLLISIADVAYASSHRFALEYKQIFKIRLLLSGHLKTTDGRTLVEGPQACIGWAGQGVEEYVVEAGKRLKMVIFHCRTDLLSDLLELEPHEMPPPFDQIYEAGLAPWAQPFPLSISLERATQTIFESRDTLPRHLRTPFLEGIAMEVLCRILGDFADRDLRYRSTGNLSTRDIDNIYEAHDYLIKSFVRPPKLSQLARLVGLNHTKLKSGFKEVFGLTLSNFIIQQRMLLATELLSDRGLSISEVAYSVGYDYPANFTSAFKRYYGLIPREWRKGAVHPTT